MELKPGPCWTRTCKHLWSSSDDCMKLGLAECNRMVYGGKECTPSSPNFTVNYNLLGLTNDGKARLTEHVVILPPNNYVETVFKSNLFRTRRRGLQ